MARYIDADKLIKDIESKRLVFKDTTTIGEALLSQGNVIREAIEKSPTADVVEVKHREWKIAKYPLTECTNCHIIRNCESEKGWEFCPNCGAKMDGERKDT